MTITECRLNGIKAILLLFVTIDGLMVDLPSPWKTGKKDLLELYLEKCLTE